LSRFLVQYKMIRKGSKYTTTKHEYHKTNQLLNYELTFYIFFFTFRFYTVITIPQLPSKLIVVNFNFAVIHTHWFTASKPTEFWLITILVRRFSTIIYLTLFTNLAPVNTRTHFYLWSDLIYWRNISLIKNICLVYHGTWTVLRSYNRLRYCSHV
jgi:hypothetical protein